jgi:hypothetical protein
MKDLVAASGLPAGSVASLAFGRPGLLRQRLEAAESADLFVSADLAQPERLADEGRVLPAVSFARNRMCVASRPMYRPRFLGHRIEPTPPCDGLELPLSEGCRRHEAVPLDQPDGFVSLSECQQRHLFAAMLVILEIDVVDDLADRRQRRIGQTGVGDQHLEGAAVALVREFSLEHVEAQLARERRVARAGTNLKRAPGSMKRRTSQAEAMRSI